MKTILDTIPWLFALLIGWFIMGMGEAHAFPYSGFRDESYGDGLPLWALWLAVISIIAYVTNWEKKRLARSRKEIMGRTAVPNTRRTDKSD